MTRKIIFLMLIFLTIEFWTFDSSACSCSPKKCPTKRVIREALKNYDVVFIGTATSVVTKKSEENSGEIQTTTFKVIENFKNAKGESIVTKIDIQCCICGMIFEEGKTYLVYAHKAGPEDVYVSSNDLVVSFCGRTVRFEAMSSRELKQLRKLRAQKN